MTDAGWLRRRARLAASAAALLWRASPRIALLVGGLQLAGAATAGGSLLVVRDLSGKLAASSAPRDAFAGLAVELALLIGLIGAGSLCVAAGAALLGLLAERVAWVATERVLDIASRVELAAFDAPEFHVRLRRAMGAGSRPLQFTQDLLAMSGSGLTLAGVVAVLFVVEPMLVLVLALAIGPMLLAGVSQSRRSFAASVHLGENDMRAHYVRGLLTERQPAKEVRAFGMAGFLRGMNRNLFEERMRELRAVTRHTLTRTLLVSVGTGVGMLAGGAVLLRAVTGGQLSLAEAATGAVAMMQALPLLSVLAGGVRETHENALFLSDYQEFCARLEQVQARRARVAQPAPATFGEIAVENVSFSYQGAERPAIEDVSLTIRRGEVVALVGMNGSGKTTLAKLLSRLYEPDQGRIRWDGTDLASVDAEEHRQHVAVAFQDFGRYLFTAGENVGIGRPEAMNDQARIEEASRAAGAHQLVGGLPRGYDTHLTREFTDGVDLSVGQWQRIALARAFFRNAPLVILDEPTASLDAVAEHELFEHIRELFAGRTVLLISHRFSTVRSADRIYTLAGGRVVEHGTHDELMWRGGEYARMFKLQAAAYQPA